MKWPAPQLTFHASRFTPHVSSFQLPLLGSTNGTRFSQAPNCGSGLRISDMRNSLPGTPFAERDQARQPTPWKSWGMSGGLILRESPSFNAVTVAKECPVS